MEVVMEPTPALLILMEVIMDAGSMPKKQSFNRRLMRLMSFAERRLE